MTKILLTSEFVAAIAVAAMALAGAAQAQVVIPPGQDFYATPMAKADMTTMPAAKIAMPAPAAKHKMMKHKKKM